jgi:hypothetical protein
MTAWLLPLLAGSFWSGILAWPALRGAVPPWALLVWGVGVLAIGALAAPRAHGSRGGAATRAPTGESARAVRTRPPPPMPPLIPTAWLGPHRSFPLSR